MTEIIADASLKNAFQQFPLKDVHCNNNLKSSSVPFVGAPYPSSPQTHPPPSSLKIASPVVPHSKLIISNMESVIRSVKKQHVVKKKKRKIVEPEISDISLILSSSLTFVSPNVSTDETVAKGDNVGDSPGSFKENRCSPTVCTDNGKNKQLYYI